ncbi:hypothetical protein JKF63_05771 [Porcisia hertigi]|uniref:Uncharacterized protein n=1 Tax=Porcisia hertigi TaxID=2761500 RepID=A0A836IX49_9TRYP|nr:hypothetical protein JKF63_05771 [Porcisia hertigi]
MSQSGDVESLLSRLSEMEGGLHRPGLGKRSRSPPTPPPPPLQQLVKGISPCPQIGGEAVALNSHTTRRSCSVPESPRHASVHENRTWSLGYGDVHRATNSNSPACGDTQEEAATPFHRVSCNQGACTPTALDDAFSRPSTPCDSHPGALPPSLGQQQLEASPPQLSLSHPVVEFLASVQLQGYAAHLICGVGIRSMPEMAEQGATSKGAAELLGPLASLQQQNEFLRGIRRWQRGEARRLKAEAAGARRRALEESHNAKVAARERCAKKTRGRAAKTNSDITKSDCTEYRGLCASETGSGTDNLQQSMQLRDAVVGCAGPGRSTGIHSCGERDCVLQPQSSAVAICTADPAPHAASSDCGEAGASSRVVVPPPRGTPSSVSFSSCNSLTTSATQLMQQLSYRCSHSRQAVARRRRQAGLCRPSCTARVDQGESGDATSRITTRVTPYDVDAVDVDAVTTTGTLSCSGSEPCGDGDEPNALRSRETSMPQVELIVGSDAEAAPADEESPSRCARRATSTFAAGGRRDEVEEGSFNAEGRMPPAELSPSRNSCESHLSSILFSLCEAAERQPAVVQQNGSECAGGRGAASERWTLAGIDAPSGALEQLLSGRDSATAESHELVRNDFVTTSNISLGALSASAELHVLPPLDLVTAPVSRGASPVAEEAYKATSADAYPTSVNNLAEESRAVCSGSQQRQAPRRSFLMEEEASQPSHSPYTASLVDTHSDPVAPQDALQTMALLDSRLADARRRLDDALREALRSYNAELKAISSTAAFLSAGDSSTNKCVPLRAVVQPIPVSTRSASACASGAEAAELDASAKLVYYMLDNEGRGPDQSSFPFPSPAVAAAANTVWPAASAPLGADAVARSSLDGIVLSPMTSTDPSARTTMISTAAPVPLSCPSTLAPAATVENEAPDGAVGQDAPTAMKAALFSSSSSDECKETGNVSCESVGLLTVGTQRPSKHVEMGDATHTSRGSAAPHIHTVGSEGGNGRTAACLWVVQECPSTAHQTLSADTAAADPDKKEAVPADEEWWEAYGIDALDYTQNCLDKGSTGRAASPGIHAAQPHLISNCGSGGLTAGVRTPSPAPVEVMELSSGSDTEDANSHGRSKDDVQSCSPDASSRLRTRAVSSPPRPPLLASLDSVRRCPTAPSSSPPMAPMLSSLPSALDRRLHAKAWSHMTNAELRDLCAEFGLLVPPPAREDATASCSAHAVARRGQSVPPLSSEAFPKTARLSAISREASPESDLHGLQTLVAPGRTTCRDLFHSSADAGDGTTQCPVPLSPNLAFTQPEISARGSSSAAPVAAAGDALDIQQRRKRRATLLERESLLETLRLLATRLCFRHRVAPFFLHRVTRLSGLPYKRMRVSDLLDEGAVLTRDDLKQARLRYKAEEQAEVDRCIVSALAAEAAEAVEQEAQRLSSRWTTATTTPTPMSTTQGEGVAEMRVTPIRGAVASLPGGGTSCSYNQILLREPVNVDAAVAVVQNAFPHISHTRVQQLLAANEVLTEVVVTARPRSPSPLASSPPPQLGSTAQLDAEQTLAVPQLGSESSGVVTHHTDTVDSGVVHTAAVMATPLSQGERQRVNARRYFAQRAHLSRRRYNARARGLPLSGRSRKPSGGA